MPSSISNFSREIPRVDLRSALVFACLLAVAFVFVLEMRLAARGFQATVIDSEDLWLRERKRASQYGHQALIVVGGSRVQLGLDLGRLGKLTGLNPVELALDGEAPLAVLEGLARDDAIRGTVIVDYYDHMLNLEGANGRGSRYETDFENAKSLEDGGINRAVEKELTEPVRRLLRSYADGARPLDSLFARIISPRATPQYLVTFPDRSRRADYRLVQMPQFYLSRVLRELGDPQDLPQASSFEEPEQILKSRIEGVRPDDNRQFLSRLAYLEQLIGMIQSRGGHVVFVNMPTSGLVRELVQHRFPRELFWNHFSTKTHAQAIHSEDYSELARFRCPDGSHLDARDQPAFTESLVSVLGIGKNH